MENLRRDNESISLDLNYEAEMQEEQSIFIKEHDENSNLKTTDSLFVNKIRAELEEIKDKI